MSLARTSILLIIKTIENCDFYSLDISIWNKKTSSDEFSWYLNNVQALSIVMHALQLDQLAEQILFLFDSVWCTLQSNDINFRMRFETQLNLRCVFLISADRLNLFEQLV